MYHKEKQLSMVFLYPTYIVQQIAEKKKKNRDFPIFHIFLTPDTT